MESWIDEVANIYPFIPTARLPPAPHIDLSLLYHTFLSLSLSLLVRLYEHHQHHTSSVDSSLQPPSPYHRARRGLRRLPGTSASTELDEEWRLRRAAQDASALRSLPPRARLVPGRGRHRLLHARRAPGDGLRPRWRRGGAPGIAGPPRTSPCATARASRERRRQEGQVQEARGLAGALDAFFTAVRAGRKRDDLSASSAASARARRAPG